MALIIEAASSSIQFDNTILEQQNYDLPSYSSASDGRQLLSSLNTWYSTGSITAFTSSFNITFDANSNHPSCITAPNGIIYMIPYSAQFIIKLDPSTGIATSSSYGLDLTATAKWYSCALGEDGKIYGIPFSSAMNTILIIDPVTDTATTGTLGATIAGTNKWIGAVLGKNGIIYCIPYTATSILQINTRNNTATTVGMTGSVSLAGTNKWARGSMAENGKIYCAPYSSTTILVIDPQRNSIYTSSMGLRSDYFVAGGHFGSALGKNGKVYFSPFNKTTLLEIDTYTDTARPIVPSNFSLAASTAMITTTDSDIYLIPSTAQYLASFNTRTLTFTTGTYGAGAGSYAGTSKWYGTTTGLDGKVYCSPLNASSILVFDPRGSGINYPNTILNRFINKN